MQELTYTSRIYIKNKFQRRNELVSLVLSLNREKGKQKLKIKFRQDSYKNSLFIICKKKHIVVKFP